MGTNVLKLKKKKKFLSLFRFCVSIFATYDLIDSVIFFKVL